MSKLSAKLTAQFVTLLVMFAISLVFVVGVGVWGLDQTRWAADKLYSDHLQTAEATAAVGLDLDDAYETAQSVLLVDKPSQKRLLTTDLLQVEIPDVTISLDTLKQIHAKDPYLQRELVQDLIQGWNRFEALLNNQELLAPAPNRIAVEAQIRSDLDPLEPVTDQLLQIEEHDAGLAHSKADDAYDTSIYLIAGATLAALLAGIAFVLFVSRRTLPRSMASEEAQGDFAEAMQLAPDQHEAHSLLKRHLERAIPTSSVVVLNSDERLDRLVALTELPPESPIGQALDKSSSRSCTAIRTARPHTSTAGRESLLSCEVCGTCPGSSLCTPLTAGGELIGSILVNRSKSLDADDERSIRISVTQALPVLANLRNLAVAEAQAATDSLTGLPNKRSLQDQLRRLVAQATRALAPLSVISIDLDHFKQVNDSYGHGRGDDVLAAVGEALRSSMRDSDVAGRNGGEEFLVMLPSTNLEGAKVVAEKIRAALGRIAVPEISRVTASLGIAAFPDHATDAEGLERAADRALYLAKANGRDRVEVAKANAPIEAVRAPLGTR